VAKIKSFSVGNGDMFFIEHGSDNFTIIDCSLPLDDVDRAVGMLQELELHRGKKGITRFISTHPDQDHIGCLKIIDDNNSIANFITSAPVGAPHAMPSQSVFFTVLRLTA